MFEHLEYDPLVNARAHRLGVRETIANDRLHQQYEKLLNILCHKPALNADDRLRVCYYLFLQDRVEEALEQFDRIDLAQLPNRLQLDYLRCLAAFYREDPEAARAIAQSYANHAVERWRDRFAEVIRQAAEIAGTPASAKPDDDAKQRDMRQDRLAASAPSLELSLDGTALTLKHRNINEVTVNCYRMDLEVLFSSNPFMEYDTRRFGLVPPAHAEVIPLASNDSEIAVNLPDELGGQNILVEVTGAGERQTRAVFANAFKVDLADVYGRLQVRMITGDSKPLAKVYVKVYARNRDGTVRFYKDGYTDLRGKFDYASLNPGAHEGVEEFALLLISDEHGALVTYAAGL